jgi:hypothetical protein
VQLAILAIEGQLTEAWQNSSVKGGREASISDLL